VLLHPTVGVTKPGDLQYYARVRCYEAICRHFPHGLVELSLLPLAMRMAGPRETLWHAIIHQNCGCSHFLVGPQHASPPVGRGAQFFGPYESQELVTRHADELGIRMLSVEEHRYAPSAGRYLPLSELEAQGLESLDYPEEAMRLDLALGRPVPEWFSYPDVLAQLRRAFPPRSRLGFTLFFTGLSGSGKSTLAKIIYAKLIEEGSRPVTLLDGDIVRQHLSSELGFSKVHRDLNIRRIGFVASEITKNGGVAICAPIAPYRETRRAVRRMIEEHGAFIEVHVATPLEVCEARDRKGLYAKARQGLIKEFTGISDPYEVPERAEIDIDTSNLSPMEAAQEIYLHLLKEGYI
jgi:sulfate adenylyltransferase